MLSGSDIFSQQNLTFFCKNRYPDMVLVYSIGKSVEGRDLWVTRISKQVKKSHGSRQKRQLLKPWFKIIANTHGNEVSITYVKFFCKSIHIDYYHQLFLKILRSWGCNKKNQALRCKEELKPGLLRNKNS